MSASRPGRVTLTGWAGSVELLHEVRAAGDRLAALSGVDMLSGLAILFDVAQVLIRSVVGVSLTMVLDDEPFTVTAPLEAISALDASRYLAGGP